MHLVLLNKWIALTGMLLLAWCVTASAKNDDKQKKQAEALRAEVQDCLPPDGSPPEPDVAGLYTQLEQGGNHEAVRLCYEIGVQAMRAGRVEEATRVLDAAYKRIQAVTANDDKAKKARKLTHGESEKNFLGEPYEQEMICLLRGLLYMNAGEYENARAVFRSGALVDRSSEDAPQGEQYHDDMSAMDYLDALCNIKLEDERAQDMFRFAREHARDESAVFVPQSDFNTVLVVMLGDGPGKYRTGEYGQFLRFLPGSGASGPLEASVSSASSRAYSANGPLENTTFQATTRGDREVDAILNGKAQFKTGASVVGDIAFVASVGATVANQAGGKVPYLSSALSLFGTAAKAASKAANPAADIRMVQPLPDDIYIFPANLEPGAHTLTLTCPDTGVSSTHDFMLSGANCEPVLIWDTALPIDTQKIQREKLAAALNDTQWNKTYAGYLRIKKDKFPVVLKMKEEDQGKCVGAILIKKTGTDICAPCKIALDKNKARIEFREDLSPRTGQCEMCLGKLSNGGKKVKGEYYQVSSAGVYPIGKFELTMEQAK